MASGFKDYYIVQFRNKFDAETAFNIYKETDYIKSVSPDVQCISLNEENQTTIFASSFKASSAMEGLSFDECQR